MKIERKYSGISCKLTLYMDLLCLRMSLDKRRYTTVRSHKPLSKDNKSLDELKCRRTIAAAEAKKADGSSGTLRAQEGRGM